MAPQHLYTPQTQNGATPPLYTTNPERRHTTSIPHKPRTAPHDRYNPCARARLFTTLRARASIFNTLRVRNTIPATQNYDRKAPTFALIYLIHFIHLTHLIHLNQSIHLIHLIQLIHLTYLIHLTHFT